MYKAHNIIIKWFMRSYTFHYLDYHLDTQPAPTPSPHSHNAELIFAEAIIIKLHNSLTLAQQHCPISFQERSTHNSTTGTVTLSKTNNKGNDKLSNKDASDN